ncbi:hypothetical protein ACR3LQ_03585 [Kosakonia cowanii]|jgi:hypothetical protein|uniref:hypothetical protein n=1 Tax=Kosakonia cowanii TaxID=208223 RepID=UPI003EE436C4
MMLLQRCLRAPLKGLSGSPGSPFLLVKTVTSAIGFKSEKYISAMKYGVWPGYDAGGA